MDTARSQHIAEVSAVSAVATPRSPATLGVWSFASRVQGFFPALMVLAVAIGVHYISLHLFARPGAVAVAGYLVAIMVAGWCGYFPGLLVAALVAGGVPYLFQPSFTIRSVNWSGLGVLMVVTLLASRTAAVLRRNEQALRVSNLELDERVREKTEEVDQANTALRSQLAELERAQNERVALLEREQEARSTAELLNRVGPMLVSELDLNKLVQSVTDLATTLTGAEFGAFFHNVTNEKGEAYTLYSLSGVPREAFAGFPMPRNTAVFAPTFRGEGMVRCEDVTKDPRYGQHDPHFGMPTGHLPVKSYLAAPVVSRSGEVLGGLFFGHSAPGKFTERHEMVIAGIAAQSAIAMDNARLFEQAQWSQNELKRSNEELRKANRDLETFAYSASHDLREPLRNVAIYSQLLKENHEGLLQGEAAHFLTGILDGALRMEALINDLLVYSRATKNSEGPPPSVNAGEILKGVMHGMKSQIEETQAKIVADKLPVLAMHEVHLTQIFQNLVGNAIKYKREEAPRINVSAVQREGWWIFSVADNGIGIDPKYRNQIFGLFRRLHGREDFPGSGVGLAICQRIVEQYDGRIWVEQSKVGGGSTFAFAIPDRRVP